MAFDEEKIQINRCRYDTAVSEREELERELNNLRSNVDDCTLGRVDLERKLMTLREELDFDNLAHAEVRELSSLWIADGSVYFFNIQIVDKVANLDMLYFE